MEQYLTTAEVAARYRTAASTVRFWRHVGYGPKGIKVGRRVLYPKAELELFESRLAAEEAAADSHKRSHNDDGAGVEPAPSVENASARTSANQ